MSPENRVWSVDEPRQQTKERSAESARIAGYNAHFVDLQRFARDAIIARTWQEVRSESALSSDDSSHNDSIQLELELSDLGQRRVVSGRSLGGSNDNDTEARKY
jgi:hypothetical protein